MAIEHLGRGEVHACSWMQFFLDDFRAGLWDAQNLACTGTVGYLGSGLEISSNTIWSGATLPNNGEVLIQGNLTVKAGYELEIKEDVILWLCRFGMEGFTQ
ncbi:MAG: hypothetical protein J5I98_07600 [Phaeodactylibacter sp.]|nr:hypothetical protein [Phaeodactylibacter sp.]